jgi:hypothetical protein
MYPDLEEAQTHARRAAGLHRADISIVREPGGFTLHVDPPETADVADVIEYKP